MKMWKITTSIIILYILLNLLLSNVLMNDENFIGNIKIKNTTMTEPYDTKIKYLYKYITIYTAYHKCIVTINSVNYIDFIRTSRENILCLLIIDDNYKVIKSIIYNFADSSNPCYKLHEEIKNLNDNTIFIIVSCGYPFEYILQTASYDHLRSLLDSYDSSVEVFTKYDNYVFVGSKNKHIYEKVSPNTIMFPPININKQYCKENPYSINPKKTIFYDGITVQSCILDAITYGKSKIMVNSEHCIPLTDEEYNKMTSHKTSNKCYSVSGLTTGIGSDNGSMVYSFDLNNDDIEVYTDHNYKGKVSNMTIFDDYSRFVRYDADKANAYSLLDNYLSDSIIIPPMLYTKKQIKSAKIPNNRVLYLIKEKGNFKSLIGPKNVPYINEGSGILMKVDRITDNGAILYGSENDLSAISCHNGSNVIDYHLYQNIKYVKLGPKTKYIKLYSDGSFNRLEQTILNTAFKSIHLVTFPRIIRSVVVY